MIHFLRRAEDHRAGATLRAGGTDLEPRRRLGLVSGPVDDLRDVPGISTRDGARLGAGMRLSALAADPELAARWPLLPMAIRTVATPQVRTLATLGGNLFQGPRCGWYRDPGSACRLRGATDCAALSAGAPDLGLDGASCASPHPSTLACVLLAYEAGAETTEGAKALATLLATGCAPGEVLKHVVLGTPDPDERAHYARAARRTHGVHPIVEVAARHGAGRWVIVAGGIAAVPRRLGAVEAALAAGALPSAAAARAGEGLATDWKGGVLVGLVQDVIEATW